MGQRRVVVTGIGMICALGLNARDSWRYMICGHSAIRQIEAVDMSALHFANGAEVRGFDPRKHFDSDRLGLYARHAQFATVAARESVMSSGIEWTARLREQTAVIIGASVLGQDAVESLCSDVYHGHRVSPLGALRTLSSAAPSLITMEFGVHGPAYTVSSACASSSTAIGHAFRMVRSGDVELALAGGGEAPLCQGHLYAWDAMRVVAPDTCRPFSKRRRGMIVGEGGAMLVLEPLEAAEARGARIYAEIAGFGMTSDAHHITRPSGEGAARAMRAALQDADIAPEQIGYINAHGTGTVIGDCIEARAIRDVFGSYSDRIAVSSTKSMHGHALGASGALEAVATVIAMREGVLPPTANFLGRDPECDLDVIPNRERVVSVEAALSNSFAFGGLNAVLAFRAYQGSGTN